MRSVRFFTLFNNNDKENHLLDPLLPDEKPNLVSHEEQQAVILKQFMDLLRLNEQKFKNLKFIFEDIQEKPILQHMKALYDFFKPDDNEFTKDFKKDMEQPGVAKAYEEFGNKFNQIKKYINELDEYLKVAPGLKNAELQSNFKNLKNQYQAIKEENKGQFEKYSHYHEMIKICKLNDGMQEARARFRK